ncbi:MAG: RnfABCDGE type electron transport complex subunit D [Clostridia bacterium]|nr:RnfABCDGE type electron transport complex subunit D [Clostridia bacterium]
MKLFVSSSPHLRSKKTTTGVMLDVVIALMPALVMAVVYFGFQALLLAFICVATCVLTEYICRKVMKRKNTITDLSAVVTGLLLALNLPVGINPFIAVFGCVVAIVVVKQMFGGIGYNFVNPALAARVVLMVSFPTAMTTWTNTRFMEADAVTSATTVDAVTSATPLAAGEGAYSYLDLFLGNIGGSMGEVCTLAILLGGLYLVIRRVISPIIPVVYLGTAAIMSLILGLDPLYQLMSGGIMLGAVFMATDYVTSPITKWGKVIFGVGLGVLTMLIRTYSNLPEGVSFAILLMNILVPHIETLTKPRAFGESRKKGDKV